MTPRVEAALRSPQRPHPSAAAQPHGRGEVCVCFFIEVLDQPQPKISRHLAYLRSAGLVSTTREGKWDQLQHRAAEATRSEGRVRCGHGRPDDDRAMQRDRAALSRACCSPGRLDQLRRAPRPAIANAIGSPYRK